MLEVDGVLLRKAQTTAAPLNLLRGHPSEAKSVSRPCALLHPSLSPFPVDNTTTLLPSFETSASAKRCLSATAPAKKSKKQKNKREKLAASLSTASRGA